MKLEFNNNQLIITKDDGSIFIRKFINMPNWEQMIWEFIATLDDATDPQVIDNAVAPLNAKIEAIIDAIAIKPTTSEQLISALTSGGIVKVSSDFKLNTVAGLTGNVVMELDDNVVITSSQDRVFNIDGGSLSIDGGGIDVSNGFVALVKANSTLNISNCTLKDSADNGLLFTNGTMSGTDINITDSELIGENYFPGEGKYVFTNCTFECPVNCAYFKSGEITFRNCHFKTTGTKGNWAHWNNGSITTSNCLVVEACDYSAHGNPKVNVIDCTFEPAEVPEGSRFKNYGLLVINYNGNAADMSGTTVPYRLADVSGHVTTGSNIEPPDGWYYFNDNNTILVNA